MKRKKSYKIILTVLLCITFLITLSSGLFLELDERNNWSSGLYSFQQSDLAGQWMQRRLGRMSSYIVDAICEGKDPGNISLPQGVTVRLLSDSGEVISDQTGSNDSFVSDISVYLNTSYNKNASDFARQYRLQDDAQGKARLTLQGYLRSPIVWGDAAYWVHQIYQLLSQRTLFEILLPAGAAVFLILLAMLLSAVGHSKKVTGIDDSGWHRIPLDLLLVLCGGMLFLIYAASVTLLESYVESAELIILLALAAVIVAFLICLLLLTTIAVRIKANTLFKNTLLYRILSLLINACKAIPFSWKGLLAAALLVGMNFLAGFRKDPVGVILVGAMDAVALIALALLGSQFAVLKDAGDELAKGNLLHTVDTAPLWSELKEHGSNLNQVGHIIQAAVSAQLKSDRFKTELITNVSHDLRTPLTNIVNYVDLLKKRRSPRGQRQGISRHSRRSVPKAEKDDRRPDRRFQGVFRCDHPFDRTDRPVRIRLPDLRRIH